MGREDYADDQDFDNAVNDEPFERFSSRKKDTLCARRQVESLLEERRLKRAIQDEWDLDFSDEEE